MTIENPHFELGNTSLNGNRIKWSLNINIFLPKTPDQSIELDNGDDAPQALQSAWRF